MKIAIIQASSQREKNSILENTLKQAVDVSEHEIINFGVFPEDDFQCSYIETALAISLLLSSKAVDFVVTGCSSGQGMMLACNNLPGVMCGYVPTPADGYLFGRINAGNAISYPLGLNWGWAGELNLLSTLKAVFAEPFGQGYPAKDAARKQRDTKKLKDMASLVKKDFSEICQELDPELLKSVKQRKNVYEYILQHGQQEEKKNILKNM